MCKNCETNAELFSVLQQQIADIQDEILMMKMAIIGVYELKQDPRDEESNLTNETVAEAS